MLVSAQQLSTSKNSETKTWEDLLYFQQLNAQSLNTDNK